MKEKKVGGEVPQNRKYGNDLIGIYIYFNLNGLI